MRAVSVRVARADGERVRRRLRDEGILREDLTIGRSGDRLEFPVLRPPEPPIDGTEIGEREFEVRPAPAGGRYLERAEVPESVRARLPRSFDVVGDVVVVRLEPDLAGHEAAVGRALKAFVPGARVVAVDDGVRGSHRLRTLRVIAGPGDLRTVHRENGLSFAVDLGAAYFSPRLAREHARVAALGVPGESVLDLCCGVGPFGLSLLAIAGAGRATFVDANPSAIALVGENARRLGVADRARPVVATLEEFLPRAEPHDRVVVNLPHEGYKYLAQVGPTVAAAGTLHHYEIMQREQRAERLDEIPRALGPAGTFGLLDSHVVHAYSPSSDLVAVTLRRAG